MSVCTDCSRFDLYMVKKGCCRMRCLLQSIRPTNEQQGVAAGRNVVQRQPAGMCDSRCIAAAVQHSKLQ